MTTTFAGYDVLGRVAAGATGVVWKAFDPGLARPVAIKELHGHLVADPGERLRLREEARLLATLDEPHIVRVYDFVEDVDRAWIVEEWIDGASLARVLESTPRLVPEQAVAVLRGALIGLAHAHDRGLVHRDVKPANILVDRDGVSKLVDFGIAGPSGQTGSTGTPAYTSPEAANGDTVDARSDVYSAAAVLFHLLSGKPPYAGEAVAVLQQHQSAPVPRLPGFGSHLADVVARAMAKSPADRPADAREFLRQLEDAAENQFGAGWLARGGVATTVAGAMSGSSISAPSVAANATAPTQSATVRTGVRVGRRILRLRPAQLVAVSGAAAAGIVAVTAVAITRHSAAADVSRQTAASNSATASLSSGTPDAGAPSIPAGATASTAATLPGVPALIPPGTPACSVLTPAVAAAFVVNHPMALQPRSTPQYCSYFSPTPAGPIVGSTATRMITLSLSSVQPPDQHTVPHHPQPAFGIGAYSVPGYLVGTTTSSQYGPGRMIIPNAGGWISVEVLTVLDDSTGNRDALHAVDIRADEAAAIAVAHRLFG